MRMPVDYVKRLCHKGYGIAKPLFGQDLSGNISGFKAANLFFVQKTSDAGTTEFHNMIPKLIERHIRIILVVVLRE